MRAAGLGMEGGGGSEWVTPGQDEWVSAIDEVVPGAGQSAATRSVMTGADLLSSFREVLGTVALTIQQKQILDAQMERMRAGLPPLNASQYGVGVSVGVSPDVQKLLLGGGIVLLLALLLLRKR